MGSFWNQLKLDLAAALVEFCGTMLFLLIGLGGIQAAATSNLAAKANDTTPAPPVANIETLLFIATSMGLSLLATAWTFFRVCGSVFNPNVAIALLLTGALKPMRFVLYVCAEIVAGIVAAALLKAALPGELAVNCTLGPGVTNGQAVVIEGFLTFALTLTVLFVAVEKHRATAFAPCAIGLVLFATHLFGVIYTGAALNSARAFGPAVLTGFTSYHWVYWVGPSVGALIATAIYYMLKAIDLYSLNPNQDSHRIDDSPDLMGIEVRMRRRNSYGSSSASRSGGHPERLDYNNIAPLGNYMDRSGTIKTGVSPFGQNLDLGSRRGYDNERIFQNYQAQSEADYNTGKVSKISLVDPEISRSHLRSPSSHYGKGHYNLKRAVTIDRDKAANSYQEELKEIPIWSPYSTTSAQPIHTI